MEFKKTSITIYVFTGFLLIFGIMTLREGGAVLFFDSTARAEAGNYVPFVLWFNFIAGFFYIIAALGIFFKQIWATKLSYTIAFLSAIIFVFLLLHIARGGLYEIRTVVAMALRTLIWCGVGVFLYKNKLSAGF